MKFEMNLNPEPYDLIERGIKTIEMRLYDERRRSIKINDIIEFTNTADDSKKMSCKVKNLYRFRNFEELYSKLPLLKCGYIRENVASANPSDMNKYYSDEQIRCCGVIGIELEICKKDLNNEKVK